MIQFSIDFHCCALQLLLFCLYLTYIKLLKVEYVLQIQNFFFFFFFFSFNILFICTNESTIIIIKICKWQINLKRMFFQTNHTKCVQYSQ